jgi:transcriptional regulator with XRE-family HTH domain
VSDPLDPDEVHHYLCRQIQRRAKQRGLSIAEVAKNAEIGTATLYRLLAGERSPRLRTLATLAAALGCRPSQLLP